MTNKWYDGVGLPSNLKGKDEDYYLHLTNGDIYKKSLGMWMRIGNIKGAKGSKGEDGTPGLDGRDGLPGEDGANGKKGNSWIDGVGDPSQVVGEIDDYYLDIETADIYKKVTRDNWDRIGNISAPKLMRRKFQEMFEKEILLEYQRSVLEISSEIEALREEKKVLEEEIRAFRREVYNMLETKN